MLITTKYLGPTNFKGSRIKASSEKGSVTLSYASELDGTMNHCRAALHLALKQGLDLVDYDYISADCSNVVFTTVSDLCRDRDVAWPTTRLRDLKGRLFKRAHLCNLNLHLPKRQWTADQLKKIA